MGNPSPHLQLRIPTPDKQSLSFCDASPQALAKWINNLPKANLGETARLLYQCLAELNQLQTPASNRMQLMELLRPEVLFVCKHMEKHFLNQSVVLEERPRKVANLCQALQNHLSTGYKLIVAQEAGAIRKEQTQLLATAIERSLSSMFGPLVRSCQLYCPVPEGLWLEMHLLYRIASSLELQNLPIKDPLSQLKTAQTVENTYLAALMLGCARTNQMRQNAIASLAEVMTAWAPLVQLEAADSNTTQFWIDPQQDAPPRLKSLFPEGEEQGLLGINPAPLLAAIEEYLQADKSLRDQTRLPLTDRLQPEQIQHLGAAWGDAAERAFRRMPSEGSISICIGMTSIHYYLAGEKAFGDSLKNPVNAGNASFKNSKPGATDIWARSFDAQPSATLVRGEPVEEIQYDGAVATPPGFGGNPDNERYPVYSVQLINHSPSGFRLSWPREVPTQLQAGELLGIQDPAKKSWSLAAVRWIRQVRGGGTQMGVELLAPSAQPCGLQLIRKADQSSQFLRALLLPEIKAISRPPSLITPRLPFQAGNRVLISLNGVERRATLDEKQSFTGSFSRFAFHYNQVVPIETPHSQKGKTTDSPSGTDDFDSLWKSL